MSTKKLDQTGLSQVWSKIVANFVGKEDGKGLSSNDYTTTEKQKLQGIATGANKTTVDTVLSSASTNPVQNKVVKEELDKKLASASKGAANGVAELDENGKVPTAQLPAGLPADGGNAATVGGHTVEANVPANAKFTDTTYSAFKGATTDAAGGSGLVPAPAKGTQAKYLRADGTWQTPPNTTYSPATASANGLMSAADKSKLDGIGTTIDNKITAAISGVYKFKGSISFANLPTTNVSAGDTYNITNAFTTTASFTEGAGKSYPAGTNVSYTSDGKWDCLAGIYDFSGYLLKNDLEDITADEIDAICVMPTV